jgi:hypothetical protein
MLFTARRGLREEYDEIANGERCQQVQSIIPQVAEGMGGRRDRRMLLRHIRHCVVCRQEAVAMGVDGLTDEMKPRVRVRSAASKAAALLPWPFFLRRRGVQPELSDGFSGARVQASLSQIGALGPAGAEHATSVAQKAVALVAAAAVVGGSGVVAHKSGVDLPLLKAAHGQQDKAGEKGPSASGLGSNDRARAGLPDGAPARFRSSGRADSGSPVDSVSSPTGTQVLGAVGSAPESAPQSTAKEENRAQQAPGTVGPVKTIDQGAPTGNPDASTPSPAAPAKPIKSAPQKHPIKAATPKVDATPTPPVTVPESALPPGVLRAPGLRGKIPPGLARKLGLDPQATLLPADPAAGQALDLTAAP